MELINFVKLDNRAFSPKRNYESDAGLDLIAMEDCIVPSLFKLYSYSNYDEWNNQPFSDEGTKIKTGIAFEIPVGKFGLICDRSGMGSKLLKTLGGVIDASYRGDVTVCLMNLSFKDYHIKAGDKIAQLVIMPCSNALPYEVKSLSETKRGDNGFGSSGQ